MGIQPQLPMNWLGSPGMTTIKLHSTIKLLLRIPVLALLLMLVPTVKLTMLLVPLLLLRGLALLMSNVLLPSLLPGLVLLVSNMLLPLLCHLVLRLPPHLPPLLLTLLKHLLHSRILLLMLQG
ncbi:hypothetical protein IWW50_003329 [Coemansia erecta]|nr:hypothetical protein IWW50_003329 [Coemansia erecta]